MVSRAKLAKVLLIFLNSFFFVSGLAILGVGGYCLRQPRELTSLFPMKALTMAVFIGTCLILFSIVGIWAASTHRRAILFVYATLIFVAFVVELVAGAIIASYLKLVSDTTIPVLPSDLRNKAEQDLISALNATYEICCIHEPSDPACSWISIVSPGCVKGEGLDPDHSAGL